MHISKENVEHLARLAHMKISPEEVDRYQGQLELLLETIERLQDIEVEGLPETYQISGAENALREDEATYTFEKSDMLATMPEVDEVGQLRVPVVMQKAKKNTAVSEVSSVEERSTDEMMG